MPKKRSLFPEDEEDIRKNTNPFEKEDEEDGVDLNDPLSEKNSFLDVDDMDDEVLDEDDEEGFGMDSLW